LHAVSNGLDEWHVEPGGNAYSDGIPLAEPDALPIRNAVVLGLPDAVDDNDSDRLDDTLDIGHAVRVAGRDQLSVLVTDPYTEWHRIDFGFHGHDAVAFCVWIADWDPHEQPDSDPDADAVAAAYCFSERHTGDDTQCDANADADAVCYDRPHSVRLTPPRDASV
jgi:hypothetical protein